MIEAREWKQFAEGMGVSGDPELGGRCLHVISSELDCHHGHED